MRYLFRPRMNLFDMAISGACLGAAINGTSWWLLGAVVVVSVVFSAWMEVALDA